MYYIRHKRYLNVTLSSIASTKHTRAPTNGHRSRTSRARFPLVTSAMSTPSHPKRPEPPTYLPSVPTDKESLSAIPKRLVLPRCSACEVSDTPSARTRRPLQAAATPSGRRYWPSFRRVRANLASLPSQVGDAGPSYRRSRSLSFSALHLNVPMGRRALRDHLLSLST